MIIRPDGDHLLLITQPDHARLSCDFIAAWRDGGDGRPREEILLAVREHDNGWREMDAAPRVDAATGHPYDFMHAPPPIKQSIWTRGIERLRGESRLAAALGPEHVLTIHAHHRQDDEWRVFLDRMEATRDGLLTDLGMRTEHGRAQFEQDYDLLFLGDLLSLVFSNGWTDTIDARRYRVQLRGSDLRVSPDPFAGATVRLDLGARRIPAHRYENDEQLRTAWASAERVRLTGTARGDV